MENVINEAELPKEKEQLEFVFLGGTCNDSKWRDELMPILTDKKIAFFNPVVEDWTPECKEAEDFAKRAAMYELYVITPEMTGVYSIAEMMYCACNSPTRLIICIPEDDRWDEGKRRSLEASVSLAQTAGGKVHGGLAVAYCSTLEEVANYLNVGIHGTTEK